MHRKVSSRKIETTIDGERVCGTVQYIGSADITVRLEEPVSDRSAHLHIPNLARSLYPDGFLGAYGEETALDLLKELFQQHKRGDPI
ncbi:MAG: hypothetical protein JO022_15735 [Acidobacteriaceae bacterium]|nr:hypothetical protein [Acidobacteriaceae bacterium]